MIRRTYLLLAFLAASACALDSTPPAPFERWTLTSITGDELPIVGTPEGSLILRDDGTFRLFLLGDAGGTRTTVDILGDYTEVDAGIAFDVEEYCAGVVGEPRPCDPVPPYTPIVGTRGTISVTVAAGDAWAAEFHAAP